MRGRRAERARVRQVSLRRIFPIYFHEAAKWEPVERYRCLPHVPDRCRTRRISEAELVHPHPRQLRHNKVPKLMYDDERDDNDSKNEYAHTSSVANSILHEND